MSSFYRVDGFAFGKWEPVVNAESESREAAEKKAEGWLTPSLSYGAYARTRIVKVLISEELIVEMSAMDAVR